MTTADIEAQANRGNIAGADLNIKSALRRSVIPAFFLDVGDVAWLRSYGTLSVVAGTRDYDLPDDFSKMRQVGTKPPGMPYIGEDMQKVLEAESNTVPGSLAGYYIIKRVDSSRGNIQVWKALRLDRVPAQAVTIPYAYSRQPFFTDDTTEVDMAQFMPEELHFGLVHALRAHIILDRYSDGDARFITEMKFRDEWIRRAVEHKEQGRRNYAVFAN